MKINGGIRYCENGLTTSLRAMHVHTELIGMYNENVTGFDKVGYQRKDPVISSFTEVLGVHGLSQTVDDKVGRIAVSDNPLDLALAKKGYFQVQSKDGVKLSRDGRFKIDKNGYLLTIYDEQVLSNAGVPVKLPFVPDKIEDIKIDTKGAVSVFNHNKNKFEKADSIGVVDANGIVVMNPEIKQGYNEYSNVTIEKEFLSMMPVIRNFDANRQMFMIQNQKLQKVIAQLGSP